MFEGLLEDVTTGVSQTTDHLGFCFVGGPQRALFLWELKVTAG